MSSSAALRLGLAAMLALLLAACAAVTGSGDPNVAATVNGTEIPVSEVEQRFDQAKQQPQVAQQLEADTEGAYAGQLQAQILSQLVVAELLEQWAGDLGIEASEEDVAAERESLVEQLGGQEAFDDAVAQSGLSAAEVDLQIRQRVLQTKISDSVAGDVDVSDADVQAFYDENADAQYGETAVARHILVEDRAEAQDLMAQLEDGADFAELAQEHSTDTGSGAEGGELPEFGRGQMVPEFEEAVFSAEPGELVGPVQTQFGFHIIEVLELNEGRSLDEVRGEIEQQLSEQQQNELLQSQLAERTQNAEVTVNPRFGTWNPDTGQVEPSNPLGETQETQEQATDAPGGEVPEEFEPPVDAPTE